MIDSLRIDHEEERNRRESGQLNLTSEALVWEPLKAADPGGFGLAFHLRRGMSHEVSKHPHFIWYLIFAPQLVVA